MIKKSATSILILVLSSWFITADRLNAYTYRKNFQRTAITIEQAYPGLSVKWNLNVAPIRSSPVISDGIVYVGCQDGFIYAIESHSNEIIWQFQTEESIFSSPAVVDGVIYIPSQDGHLYAIDAFSGTLLWQYDAGGRAFSSPLVVRDLIIWGAGHGDDEKENHLIAVDKEGNFRWKFDTGQLIHSSPATDGEYIYFASNSGKVYKLSFDNNSAVEVWSYQTIGNFGMGTLSVDEGIVYFAPGGDERVIYALNTLDGSRVWANDYSVNLNTEGHGVFVSSIATDKDKIYVAMHSVYHWIYAVNKSDGSLAWSKNLGVASRDGYVSSPVIANDILYIGGADGYLYALTTSSGGMVGKFSLGVSRSAISSIPLVSNGIIYVANMNGALFAFEAAKIAAISSPDNNDSVSGNVQIKGSAVNPDFKSYRLEYSTSSEGQWLFISSSTAAVNNGVLGQWDASNIVKGTYYVKLTVLENTPSGTDNTAVIKVALDNPPPPPTALSAFDTANNQNSITVNWTKSTDDGAGDNDVTEYRLFRSTVSGIFDYENYVSISSGTNFYIDTTGIINNTTYYYVIKSFAGIVVSSKSVQTSAWSINLFPAPPTNVAFVYTPGIAPGDGGALLLSWKLSSDDGGGNNDVVSYYVYRSTMSGEFFLPLKILSAGTTFYVDRTLTEGYKYYYALRSYDGEDFSIFSEEVSITSSSRWEEAGGTVVTADGVEVVFEPGTLDADDYIKITKLGPGEFSNEGLPDNVRPLSEAWEFNLFSTKEKFNKLVTVKIPYEINAIPNLNEEYLRLYLWNDVQKKWTMINTSEPHPHERRVWARLSHFSIYRIMEFIPTDLIQYDSVYVYPNPARRVNAVYFKYRVGDNADVSIEIYNIAGERIAQLNRNNNRAGIVYQIRWDITDIASGIYIWRMRAISGGREREVIKKLGIIK